MAYVPGEYKMVVFDLRSQEELETRTEARVEGVFG